MPMTEEGKAGLQSGGPNLSLFGADPPLLHSQDSAKNSPTVGGTDLHEQEKETQVIQKEGEEQKQDRMVIKKEEVELKKVGSGDGEDAIVSKLISTTTSTAISTTSTTRKPLPVNEPKPVLPQSKQLRMVSHSLLSLF